MHSFYFGSSERPLYGVSHSPIGSEYRDTSILICNSIAHEYIRSHRALRQLADKLSEMGYSVLRFDYSGVGDSSGEFSAATLADWQRDIKLAADELKAISGQERVTVIGIRMGATLSLLASEQYSFNNIIMWDPVESGYEYIQNLNTLHRKLLVDPLWFSKSRAGDTPENEFMGYQYSANMISDISSINLQETNIPEYQLLNAVYTTAGNAGEFAAVLNKKLDDYLSIYKEDMGNWNELNYIDTSLTSTQVIATICDLLK